MFRRIDRQITDCFIKLTHAADKQSKIADGTLVELRDALSNERAQCLALERVNLNLERELASTKANFDWLKAKVNQLEFERAALVKQTANLDIPVPQIMERPPEVLNDPTEAFEDIGDKLAKALEMDQFADKGDRFTDA